MNRYDKQDKILIGMTQAEVITLVIRYLSVLKQAGIPVEMAFLYGSYARNEAIVESDIDLLLVSSVFDTTDDYVLSRPWLYTTQIDPRIEPYSVGLKNFNRIMSPPSLKLSGKKGYGSMLRDHFRQIFKSCSVLLTSMNIHLELASK